MVKNGQHDEGEKRRADDAADDDRGDYVAPMASRVGGSFHAAAGAGTARTKH